MADIRSQFFGSIAKLDPINGFTGFDLSAFVQRLLLFDRHILESFGLQEIPILIRKFGYEPIITLLKTRSIKILFDPVFILRFKSDESYFRDEGNGTVRVGPFNYSVGRLDRSIAINREMQSLHGISSLNQRQVIKLKGAVGPKLVGYGENPGKAALENLNADLSRNAASIPTAVATVAGWIAGRPLNPNSFILRMDQLEPSAFDVITNIHSVHGLDEQQTIRALDGGLLMMGELNRLIETMNTFQAMTAMREEELPLLGEKLSFLVSQINPDLQTQRFRRVLQITGFPDLDEATSERVDLEKLLEIREARECREFRAWLWNADDATDEEILDQFTGLRNKLSLWAHGNVGKVLRWASSTGIGLIPGIGTVASGAIGLLDTFLLEKMLPQSGPLIFLKRQYPSLFKG